MKILFHLVLSAALSIASLCSFSYPLFLGAYEKKQGVISNVVFIDNIYFYAYKYSLKDQNYHGKFTDGFGYYDLNEKVSLVVKLDNPGNSKLVEKYIIIKELSIVAIELVVFNMLIHLLSIKLMVRRTSIE